MSEKKRLFVDMDGTLARFHDQVNYLERMFEKGFFWELEPFENMVAGIRQFIQDHPDVEVYILSARVIGEPPYCEEEKNLWLDHYLPEIDRTHRIYTDMGRSKASYIPGGVGKNDFLVDDYNKGLNLWLYDGGSAIKCHNNINQKGLGAYGGSAGALWAGAMVHTDDNPQMIAAELAHHIGLSYDLDKVIAAQKEKTDYSIFKPGSRLNSNPYTPGVTNYLCKHLADPPYSGQFFEATRASKNLHDRRSYHFENPLNALRLLENRPDFVEIHMRTSAGREFSVPRFTADALASNLYGVKSVYDLAEGIGQYPPDVADAFLLGLENAEKAVVGHVHYLGTNGRVGETAVFRSVEEMKEEIEDCYDCGRPITVDWCVQPNQERQAAKGRLDAMIHSARDKKEDPGIPGGSSFHR